MPIYEYVCQGCQHRFEVKQGIKDPPLASCVRCGQAVTKVISPPAIMFKGTGWYITDYSDKLKPKPESKTDEKSPAAQKNGDASAGAAASATPASSPPSGSPPAGSASPTPAATGTPPTSSTK